ncbi:transporter [Leptobacterium sp. I13]|uniref:transporter n=1 Tax=Leptobacterium meishanense TaxID=3128904 RepID=UPI0030EB7134
MSLIKKRITILCLSITGVLCAQEQDKIDEGTLVTDRPDQTESPTLVPKGYLQVETGAFYEDNGDGVFKEKTMTYNTTLFRYGLLDNLELRLGADFARVTTEINGIKLSDVANGLSPLLLGLKIGITEEKGTLPEIGLLGALFLPFSAGDDFRPATTGADIRLAFAHTLSEKSSLSYNLGAQWGNDSPEVAYIYTLAYGYSLTDKLGLYAELYGDFPENGTANHFWDAGMTYLLSDNIQLDATIGTGINNDQNILLSAGVSFRIPK